MITKPRFKKKQIKDIEEMKQMEGWRLVSQVIEGSISISESSLLGWTFKYDDDGNVTKKSMQDYRQKQSEIILMKQFLSFIHNPVIIQEAQEDDMYDEPE